MKFFSIKRKIKDENYLLNSYRRLTRSKLIHFLLLLIDNVLILIQEIDIFLRGFKPRNKFENKIILSPIIILINKLDNYPQYIIFILLISSMIIFDLIYLFLCKNDIKKNNILLYIIINFFELFYFRLYILLYFSLLFSLNKLYFVVAILFSIGDLYLNVINILYNHLYFYVPKFVTYPYDEFSSRYDFYLLLTKFIISISSTAKEEDSIIFCFFFNFIVQFYYCYYFINKLFFHSYLFMLNSFLNKTKLAFFFGKITILILSYLIRDNNLFTIIYFVICIDIFLIYMGIFYFIYDPFRLIYINTKTPLKNILFFLNIINKRKDIEILVENQIIDHYKECGKCNLCINYVKYRKEQIDFSKDNINENINANEKDSLIINKDNKIISLFYILYDGNKKYFEFIVKLLINYKKYGKNNFNNNSNYFINLSNLIYTDYKNKNFVLALNEKIILEIINEENNLFLENHQIQIKQLILYNEYFSLVNIILKLIKELLKSPNDFSKIEKLIKLSKLLKEMKDKKYKEYIFNRKFKNATNSKNILLSCAILYEEILNKNLINKKLPIRDNSQLSKELIDNESINNNSYITLKFDLLTYTFHIIRIGKELSSYLNYNLYDLFPPVLKQHQIDLFINLIFNGFDDKHENINDESDMSDKNIFSKQKKIKNEFIESKLIILEKIYNKTFYKLLNLKLCILFNNKNENFILFNGTYFLSENTIVSVIDLNHEKEIEEKVLGYSNLYVEQNLRKNFFSITDYNFKHINKGHKLVKLFSYNILVKIYNIYNLETKNTVKMKRRSTIGDVKKFAKSVPKKNQNIVEDMEDIDEKLLNIKKVRVNDINPENSNKPTINIKGIIYEDKKKTKKENIKKYFVGLNRLKYLIIFFIISIVLTIIFEYLIFYMIEKREYNGNISYKNMKDFFALYNQLLTSILSVSCIPEKIENKTCRNYLSIANKIENSKNKNNTLNSTEFVIAEKPIIISKINGE